MAENDPRAALVHLYDHTFKRYQLAILELKMAQCAFYRLGPYTDKVEGIRRELESIAQAIAEATGKPTADAQTKKSGVTAEGNRVTVDGETYVLGDGPAAFVKALVDAGRGVWVAGRAMGVAVQPHPERVFAKLPDAIRDKIESKRGAGYRIRPG